MNIVTNLWSSTALTVYNLFHLKVTWLGNLETFYVFSQHSTFNNWSDSLNYITRWNCISHPSILVFVCVHGTRDGTRKTAHVYNENGICLYGCFNSILRKQKNEPRIVGVKSGKDIDDDDDDDDDSRKKNISSSTSRNNENRLWRIQFLVIMLTEAWISSNWRKIMKKNRKSLCENVIKWASAHGASIGDNSTRKTNYMLWLTRMENVHDDFRAFFAFFSFWMWFCVCECVSVHFKRTYIRKSLHARAR